MKQHCVSRPEYDALLKSQFWIFKVFVAWNKGTEITQVSLKYLHFYFQRRWKVFHVRNDRISVVTVPKFLYSVPIPVKIHSSRYQFRYQSKTQNMLIKKHIIFINKVEQK